MSDAAHVPTTIADGEVLTESHQLMVGHREEAQRKLDRELKGGTPSRSVLTMAGDSATADMEPNRISRIVSRLRNREDLWELRRMAEIEAAKGLASRDLTRFDRGVAIYRAASEALGNLSARVQMPRYRQAF